MVRLLIFRIITRLVHWRHHRLCTYGLRVTRLLNSFLRAVFRRCSTQLSRWISSQKQLQLRAVTYPGPSRPYTQDACDFAYVYARLATVFIPAYTRSYRSITACVWNL